jgi:hypothetical protein
MAGSTKAIGRMANNTARVSSSTQTPANGKRVSGMMVNESDGQPQMPEPSKCLALYNKVYF